MAILRANPSRPIGWAIRVGIVRRDVMRWRSSFFGEDGFRLGKRGFMCILLQLQISRGPMRDRYDVKEMMDVAQRTTSQVPPPPQERQPRASSSPQAAQVGSGASHGVGDTGPGRRLPRSSPTAPRSSGGRLPLGRHGRIGLRNGAEPRTVGVDIPGCVRRDVQRLSSRR